MNRRKLIAVAAYKHALAVAEAKEIELARLDPEYELEIAEAKAANAEGWADELERRADRAERIGPAFDDERLEQWDRSVRKGK